MFSPIDNVTYEATGEKSSGGRPFYEVTSPYVIYTTAHVPGIVIMVRQGYTTDLASIPRLFFMLKPGASLWDDAAIIHDKACDMARKGDITWQQADDILFYAMRDRGCSLFTSMLFWVSVRIGHKLQGKR